MSLGRTHANPKLIRDVDNDYVNAYLAEYKQYVEAGQVDRAKDVAAALKALGHEIGAPKERAVHADETEKAVEAECPPVKRRGRPKKVAEPVSEQE